MQTGIDSQEESQGPLLNNKIWISIYFIIFVIIFSFFFINVFVGMIILTFQELGAAESEGILDRNTKNSFIFAVNSKPMPRYMPEDVSSWQYKAWALVESMPWELVVSGLIGINTLVLMVEFYDQPEWYKSILEKINEAFTWIFTVEFAVKLFAFGCNYFKNGWNNFDMLIVGGSLMDFMIKSILPKGTINFDPSIFRLFRAARLVKLLRRSRSLRILLWTFLQSFKALPYVGMLIFLLFFVYGIVGVQIFALIAIDSEDEPWAQINRNNHFRSYFAATQVLFRVATGENWPNIMLACTSPARCDKRLPAVEKDQELCGTDLAYLYFISFVFLCSFLMLNLFIAVIMDSFAFLTEDSSILGPHHLDEVVTVWSEFDPRASGFIKHTEVCELLRQMLPPVGLGLKCPKVVAYKRLVQMNMTLFKDGTVGYRGTFFALVRSGLQVLTENANLKSNEQEFRKMMKEVFPNISKHTINDIIVRMPRGPKHMTIAKIYAAKLIWENYKNMKKFGQRRRSIYPIIPLPENHSEEYYNRRQSMAPPGGLGDRRSSIANTLSSNRQSTVGPPAAPPAAPPCTPPKSEQQTSTAASVNSLPSKTPARTGSNTVAMTKSNSVQPTITETLPPNEFPQGLEDTSSSQKKQIALAIRSGKSPYQLYGLEEKGADDEWC